MHSFIVESLILPDSPDICKIFPDASIGIDEVRRVRSFLSRKPIQSDHNTVVIDSAHLLTLPAQHALLKILEEPPGNSLIYLITPTPDVLLPTILSRCALIENLRGPKDEVGPEMVKSRQLVDKLLASPGAGDRLKLLDTAGFTRESALNFLNHLEIILHSNLDLGLDYGLIVATRRYLKANCNLKLCLDYLALNFTLK